MIRKKIFSLLIVIVLSAGMLQNTFAADVIDGDYGGEDTDIASEALSGDDVFTLAEAAADEAEDNSAEYDGFIFKVNDAEAVDSDAVPEIDEIDANEGIFTAPSIDDIAEAVPEDVIEYIEPDYIMELFGDYSLYSAAEPNDEYYSQDQWNIPEMNVPALWQAGIEGQDLDSDIDMDKDGNSGNDPVIVAVLDSGLNTSHEDIDISRVTNEWNFLENSSDITDDVGHGTFVAGEIMAKKDNAVGIAGIGQGIVVMPLKVFNSKTTPTSAVVGALNYVTEKRKAFNSSGGSLGVNISVITISFGGESGTESLKSAVEAAIEAGIIVICAAGNSGSSSPVYPAMYAIGVGAYDSSGAIAAFSQRLSIENGEGCMNKVWVAAPGAEIRSTFKNNSSYDIKSGTSFSCPEVAALAAICKGFDNSLDHYSFKRILKETAIAADSGLGTIDGQDIGFGWGKVDYVKACEAALGYSIDLLGKKEWVRDADGNWYYIRLGDKKRLTGWQQVNGNWYYMHSETGVMQTGWIKPGNTWYYLKDSGAMATGWQKVNGVWYYLKPSGAMATGWQMIDGTWYYMNSSGAMLTGWRKIGGTWYYLKSSGAMAANEWVAGYWWLSGSGAWDYTYKGSWHKNSSGWWFGDTSGWYVKNSIIIIDNISYEFDDRGYLK